MADLALQIALVVLLLLTITWCMIVHHRLRRLRTDKGEMQALIAALDEATARAEGAVRQMRDASREAASAASEQQRRARQQGEELARLMDNGVRLLKRLDTAVEQGATKAAELRTQAQSRTDVKVLQEAAPAPPPASPPASRAAPAPREATAGRRSPQRRPGPLDALLHGELQEALQALR